MTISTWAVLVVLALALAADAFAVAVSQGASGRHGIGGALRIGGAFGLAQGVMPLIGWALGVRFTSVIGAFDHWIAFVLLAGLGAKTIHEGLSADDGEPAPRLTNLALLGAALATSIDAAAAGVTLPALGAPIGVACAAIGIVTFAASTSGVFLGGAAGERIGKRAEVVGGAALILIGLNILIRHLFFGG
jgi:putative Mn2+ efflux pump MntP